jgi:hypothetical protein
MQIFLISRDFAGFSMRKWLYLGKELIDFDPKAK